MRKREGDDLRSKVLRHQEKMGSKTQVEDLALIGRGKLLLHWEGGHILCQYFCRCHNGEMREFLSDYLFLSETWVETISYKWVIIGGSKGGKDVNNYLIKIRMNLLEKQWRSWGQYWVLIWELQWSWILSAWNISQLSVLFSPFNSGMASWPLDPKPWIGFCQLVIVLGKFGVRREAQRNWECLQAEFIITGHRVDDW